MNHAVKAAVALALGLGLAGVAQAHGTNLRGAAVTPQSQVAMQQQMHQAQLKRQRLTRLQAKRMARARLLAMEHGRNHHRIATLHHKGMANQPVGVGSSTPNPNGTTPITPPANPAAGAGSSGTTTNDNTPPKK